MEIYFLDMGRKKYGDCIVIKQEDRAILIDGGHPEDSASIRMQLKKILNKDAPFEFDLLVVTHCHSDHIGCLPDLVALGDIKAKRSLLADPKFRWGNANPDGADDSQARFIDALFEEDYADLPDDDIELFVADAERLYPGYLKMIETLKTQGQLYLFQGVDGVDYRELEQAFADFGMSILGPTQQHLKITQESLIGATQEVSDFIRDSADSDAIKNIVDLYKSIQNKGTIDGILEIDAKKNKGAINDQSIVLSFKADNWSVLLAGDMQFADAEVSGLEAEMEKLLGVVYKAGPFQVIKTSHHTSYNGLDEGMLKEWIDQGTQLYVHSGGLNDASHPEKKVLSDLQRVSSQINFARTDRNGQIRVSKIDGKLGFAVAKKETNIFDPNIVQRADQGSVPTAIAPGTGTVTPIINPLPEAQAIPSRPQAPTVNKYIAADNANVIINATIPAHLSRVTITVDIAGSPQKTADGLSTPLEPALNNGSSRFADLLFITCSEQLKLNIGREETAGVMTLLGSFTQAAVVDIPLLQHSDDVCKYIYKSITPQIKGIVLLGGYDVIPSTQLNVLSDELRKEVERDGDSDLDDFIIWSDDIYGDTDGDTMPEIPVSRIPDGKSAELLMACLKTEPYRIGNKFGIRNLKRPFAVDIFDKVPFSGGSQLEVSETCSPGSILEETAKGAVYYMLHGQDNDGTRFYGEKQSGGLYDAFDIDNVPKSCPGTIVFSGCCWGALTALPTAHRKTDAVKLRCRTTEQSIALTYLNAGANAFVGCTGAHYSPGRPTDNFFGKPMHDSFWKYITAGQSPALALLNAKIEFAANMPHGLTRAVSRAIEIKILRQFTCLGLGW